MVGGVMSSVGKGIAAASIGKIIQTKGYRVANIKCDMYVNVDAGTIRPAEHGEVFVGEDGVEADQDLGNYERFTNQVSTRDHYMTWGSVNLAVIQKERNLEYGGEDVEVVPDIPNEIIRTIKACGTKNHADVVITEFGGTIGEYQILLFLEAARMMKMKHPNDVFVIMVSYLPTPSLLGEQKSKPTQYAIRTLNSAGINPDMILCRADKPIADSIRKTISTVCSLPKERIISAPDVSSIYDVPYNFEKEHVGETLLSLMDLPKRTSITQDWTPLTRKVRKLTKTVRIGIVGKYFNFKSVSDAYISVLESLKYACWNQGVKPEITWIDSEQLESDGKVLSSLKSHHGILVPGGFGSRGIEGKIIAARFAREHQIPYFGLCLGLQIMVIEFARSILKLRGATSEEFEERPKYPVIHMMPDQKEKLANREYGATMRLGSYPCVLVPKTKAYQAYLRSTWATQQRPIVHERHRHRYEVNNEYRNSLEQHGLLVAGYYKEKNLVEIMEVENHPFMIGVQFHPEFKSRPLNPHPLFAAFIRACLKLHSTK